VSFESFFALEIKGEGGGSHYNGSKAIEILLLTLLTLSLSTCTCAKGKKPWYLFYISFIIAG
jgi:hypothetical protein